MSLSRILQVIAIVAITATSAYTFESPATVILDGIAYKPMDSQREAITGMPDLLSAPSPVFQFANQMQIESDENLTQSWAYITEEEYKRFREIIDQPSKSTPQEVALVNLAVKGTSLFLYFVVWLIGLVIFRYVFNRWWDEDVYQQTWPSVIVISVMVICTAWVLVATVQ